MKRKLHRGLMALIFGFGLMASSSLFADDAQDIETIMTDIKTKMTAIKNVDIDKAGDSKTYRRLNRAIEKAQRQHDRAEELYNESLNLDSSLSTPEKIDLLSEYKRHMLKRQEKFDERYDRFYKVFNKQSVEDDDDSE